MFLAAQRCPSLSSDRRLTSSIVLSDTKGRRTQARIGTLVQYTAYDPALRWLAADIVLWQDALERS